MSLARGTRLGVYEVAAQIGEGGMGQVYRARDTKPNRDVALKVLPDSFAGDPDRLARFTREAQTLASLNHPNIAQIVGLEDSGGVRALVMELVEGDDLSQRIARGAISLDEVLPIARQIAEALEAAHEQGIIHRDLKPANIKLRPDGTVKVLDFGLAKALGPAEAPNSSQAPTITTPAMTQAGMILGTAAYMSPEQARGKTVDKRADIWAFGAVLFEMLTGQRAFPGEDITDTIVSVISKEPDWSTLPSATPSGLRHVLGRCLKKDIRARLRDIGEARVQIEDLLSSAPGEVASAASGAVNGADDGVSTSSAPSARPAWMVASVAVLAVATLTVPAVRHLREAPGSANEHRPLDPSGGWATGACGFPEDPFPRGAWVGLTRRPVGGLHVERIGVDGGLRPAFRCSWHDRCSGRRARQPLAGVHRGRDVPCVAT
jgi:serine/threonine protein kinase